MMNAAIETAEPRTISVPAAAALLGISRNSAYQLARQGELPGAIRLGKRIVVSRSVLERVLAGEEGDKAP